MHPAASPAQPVVVPSTARRPPSCCVLLSLSLLVGGMAGGATPAGSEARKDLLTAFRHGPMEGVQRIVYAVRKVIPEHWYANFGYYASDSGPSYFHNSNLLYRDGARLESIDLRTGVVTPLLQDPAGGIRDPQVSHDGQHILFAYRRGGTPNYLLHEMNVDGSGLRQITTGPWDDIEPTYLPDGGIAFVSSRCQRWVNCWLTQVATLHRCNPDGSGIRPLSSNNEHDNTPWPLADGRILYTRWEYVDRSQVDYHHLWVVNPDGTGQMTYFGNLHPGTVLIDAKPVPDSPRVVVSLSPGHGQTEHEGAVALVDPGAGPDHQPAVRTLTRGTNFRDPWAFSETAFLAARGPQLVLLDDADHIQTLHELPESDRRAEFQIHEPRPVVPRRRELVLQPRTRPGATEARLFVGDVYRGRGMDGVQRGDIRSLLVLESLPKPINFTGGMDPLSYGGTFTLERVLGTVPVERDGSAYFQVPALRSLFFVALDASGRSVKRMQSFVTAQPGEVTGCVGCHEPRTQALPVDQGPTLATRRGASRIQPFPEVPDVLDFPRDIQPILDTLCLDCHGPTATSKGGPYAGRILLSGDHGPMFSHSYFMLTVNRLFSDGRNEPRSSLAPRSIGSSASRILALVDGTHHGARATPRQELLLRLWIETGAPYPGTYAALGSGMLGGYAQNTQVHTDFEWPETRAAAGVLDRRCTPCHEGVRRLPHAIADELDISFWRYDPADPRLRFSRHKVFNLDRPEVSLLVLAPLAREAGGLGLCSQPGAEPVFRTVEDPDRGVLIAHIEAGRQALLRLKRFDMPGFQPRPEWVREMRRYGILPGPVDAPVPTFGPGETYRLEQAYWRSLWPTAETLAASP